MPTLPTSVVNGVRGGLERLSRETRGRLLPTSPSADAGRWLVVTVLTDRDTVLRDGLPAPLEPLRDLIALDVRTAPGDKGVEIAARIVAEDGTGAAATHSAGRTTELYDDLRLALRSTKQLLETGQVMRVDPQPAGHRPATPPGRALDQAQAQGAAKGVL